MAKKNFYTSGTPIRRTVEFLPTIFQTNANDKFLSGTLDAFIQPGSLEKTVGYVGRRYGKTFNGSDIYLDTDTTLRSRYQLEPGVIFKENENIVDFYDYLDFKNILKFFNNNDERDDLTTSETHYSWNPPVDWDKFVNYREYYWVPSGPSPIRILGQAQNIVSTYRVKLGIGDTYVFFPDGLTNNPQITLYRGQTYKFIVNAPGNAMFIRLNYDTGSWLYDPTNSYQAGQYVIYNDKLWRANRDIFAGDGSTIDENTQDWQYIESTGITTALDYNDGITNNGIENGTLTFTVPFDAPDVLYYQSSNNPDRFGRFVIADVESNTKINVDEEIIGKTTYTSSNGITLSNGMIVNFDGDVFPDEYSRGNWLVEGVGSGITLTNFEDLVIPVLSTDIPEVFFDNEGFDTAPFDDASAYPGTKDYITISKSSQDRNPWSRYNRWFHKDVLSYASRLSGSDFDFNEAYRAKRPIIEFLPDLQLFNHGSIAKQTVDFIDDYTSDVFSKIEGSLGYSIDGESLFDGARVLVTADTDSLANNKIYQVSFITHNGRRQITLKQVSDTESIAGETVLIRRGTVNQGKMYWFDGTQWNLSQEKKSVNQPPLFDAFDQAGISFSDPTAYPVSSFRGTKIFSYKPGSSIVDTELGFSLSYLNINNVGDIQFNFDWDVDTFDYEILNARESKDINSGFYYFSRSQTWDNGWLESTSSMPILDYFIFDIDSSEAILRTVDWDELESKPNSEIYFYINGSKTELTYTRYGNKFVFNNSFSKGDSLTIKIFADVKPDQGYYEIPIGLEKNPLNQNVSSFTLGQASDHVYTGVEFYSDFSGAFPGASNLRDLIDFKSKTRRFLKHSYISPATVGLLADRQVNIIKSISYAKKSYSEFKNNFLKLAEELYYSQNPVDFVDIIFKEMTKSKFADGLFSGSDMIGNGAYTAIDYLVEDTGITTFALSQPFNLTESSSKAVYVYINDEQLLNGTDYEFNSTLGFVYILKSLTEGDRLQIREYVTTDACFVPPTPTKLGLYKKFTPEKYLDTTYLTPRWMIQGHDGSRITAFGDYRDDVILELEKRIYNNIKTSYDTDLFDNDKIIGGYYGNSLWNKQSADDIIAKDFLFWISDTNIDYVNNTYFDDQESFTYTYSRMSDPSGTQNLPGWWRGVYQWFYDTDRPHSHPWEILGFSEKPSWWESQYGPAPYTKDNLVLWEDIQAGIIRSGSRAGLHPRYARPTILSHIPVDGDGNLISPLNSNLARDFVLINNQGDFKVGDISPVEHTWRISSEYPYSYITALALLKPFDFIGYGISKGLVGSNKIGQYVNTTTNKFITIDDIVGHTGLNLVYLIKQYLKSFNLSESVVTDKLSSIDVRLTHRLSGFVDQEQQKFLLDSKNPKSTSSSIFIPQESQSIIFNKSAPINSISYGAVVVEKNATGWRISGYDSSDPYFYYYEPIASQADPLLIVGGKSEAFLEWTENKFYGNGVVVRYNDTYYRSLSSHSAGTAFDTSKWKKLPKLPVTGATEAFKRRAFNTSISRLSYGTILPTIQDVVDFISGYEKYLITVGFVFDGYDSDLKAATDWTTSSKEFMYWTQQNWAEGSLITLSPAASQIKFTYDIGVPDNLLDGFYGYNILKSDGTPLPANYINVDRSFQELSVSTTDTNDGIYFLKIYQILKEHVVIFEDRTVFNDVIYDKTSGYRQERIKVRGFRTIDWDGDYTSPGFVYDAVNIKDWQSFVDYKLGDIVSYRSVYWTAASNHTSSEAFDYTKWSKLDNVPSKGLVPNFDFRINQFEDFYNLDADGLGSSQRELGRHAIGFQKRDYLQNLSEDEVIQFKLYQGFIRDKGTLNAAVKVFDKLSNSADDGIVLNEEWALRVAKLGGVEQYKEVEFNINKSDFVIEPQPIVFLNNLETSYNDQYLRLQASDFSIAETPFNPNVINTDYKKLQTAGYAALDQVQYVISDISGLENINISSVENNDHVLVTFYKTSWSVFRLEALPLLSIISAERTNSTTVTLEFNRRHAFIADEYIGIKNVPNLTGFFKVLSVVSATRLELEIPSDYADPLVDVSTFNPVMAVIETRYTTSSDITVEDAAVLPSGSRLFIDKDENNRWSILEKNKVYSYKEIADYGNTSPEGVGSAVIYLDTLRQTITSMPGQSLVMSYIESTAGLNIRQIIIPETYISNRLSNSFGQTLAYSPDEQLLAVGAPLASGVPSDYVGEFDPISSYQVGDIVLYNGVLWRAKINISGDSSINIGSEDWEPVTMTEPVSDANNFGPRNQGMVFVYRWSGQTWNLIKTIISPRQTADEKFGSTLSIGVNGSEYWLAVGAPGAVNDTGRVYIFKYDGITWNIHADNRFMGVYDSSASKFYPEGSIVWIGGYLWKSLRDQYGDGSSISATSDDWIQIDPISTSASLPHNIALPDDDGSTLASGLLNTNDLAELIKQGDQFGSSIAFNRDASVLVVGVPNSDGQYFANYRGYWKAEQEYFENDVVKHQADGTYKYVKLVGVSSSINDDPSSEPWLNIGDSTTYPSGKVFIYLRDQYNNYKLHSSITAESIVSISDIADSTIHLGDAFGYSVDIDASGTNIVIGSPYADVQLQNQGSVYLLSTSSLTSPEWRLKQKIYVDEIYNNVLFGSAVSITADARKIAVGAKNDGYHAPAYFGDVIFDGGYTTFSDFTGYTGQVYIFERVGGKYLLAEKLETDLTNNESFGSSVDANGSAIAVGSPTYKNGTINVGMVRLFRRDPAVDSLTTLSSEAPLTDIDTVKNIALIVGTGKVADVEVVDSAKLKILGAAEQEIKFKTPYDPAVYTNGTEDVVIDEDTAWFNKNVGKVWWDISKAKWYYYEQGDVSYRIGNWNQLAEGASIDIYEWVETSLLPSEWSAIADTVEGLSLGISGQPLYPNDTAYSEKVLYNTETLQPTDTKYYYWVKSSTIAPDVQGRTLSTAEISELISNPAGSGIPFVSFVDTNKILAYNVRDLLTKDTGSINIEFYKDLEHSNLVHKEYQLISEGVADSLPTEAVETKWIDSLIGFDSVGNPVPDPALSNKRKYGILYRPRQSMFVDRLEALKITIEHVNGILENQPFADLINFDTLNLVESPPIAELKEYDEALDTYLDLEQYATVLGQFFPNRVRQAFLSVNIINGEIDTIDIVDPGFGYKVAPMIEIVGAGIGATAEVTIDNQGRVNSATILTRGKKYDSAFVKIRAFSILIRNDETVNGFWSIYSWDQTRSQFYRTRTQAYDTTKYWSYIDWWKSGYTSGSRVVTEILGLYQESELSLDIGDLLRIKEYNDGGWAVLERVQDGTGEIKGNYTLVGRERGTIKFLDSLYNITVSDLGYDDVGSYDATLYDSNPSLELRNIFSAIKNDIFINDLRVEWNNLFFVSIRYVLFENKGVVDWIFKTSFVNAIHNVGTLEQKLTYKSDNLESFKSYLEEVKPYRTTIREYTSRYVNLESTNTDILDFDSPPVFDVTTNKLEPVGVDSEYVSQSPWSYWYNNLGFSISEIQVSNPGSGYTYAPTVLISGNGTGASAKAFISNGKVSGIRMISMGYGYTSTPTVSLVGGNGSGNTTATAVAILGDSLIRSMNLSVRFDRISKSGIFNDYTFDQSFTASGNTSVFTLSYAPTRDKSKITIYKNGQIVLTNDYTLDLYYDNTVGYTLLKGKINFVEKPEAGDIIDISFEKNQDLFDAVNRINKFYAPTSGMLGNDLGQLMTGIDFGGVEIQGTTFDVTGGWDALPWFTDGWDSVESNSDYYIVVDGSTTTITLPYTPTDGQYISVYIKRYNDNRTIRLDDPYFSSYDGTTIQPNGRTTAPENAVMPSIVGDGSTRTYEIHDYISTVSGDTLIFRPFDSDGSVSIKDVNIIDTDISGGTLAAISGSYSTANGLTADEITIDGSGFITPEQVPAPEENLPGQVLDSLAIKVFQSTEQGASPLNYTTVVSDGLRKTYPIGINVLEANSVIVYVDKDLYNYAQDSSLDYIIDFTSNEVTFSSAPAVGSIIEIIGIGRGGISLIDYTEFVADGNTGLFLTRAEYSYTSNVLVTVDGIIVDVGFVNSTDMVQELGIDVDLNKTMIQFAVNPPEYSIVKIITLGSAEGVESYQLPIIKSNNQLFFLDGVNRSFALTEFNILSRGSAESSMIVQLNSRKLKGPDTYYETYTGSNNIIYVGTDPRAVVTSVDIRVYINNVIQPFVTAYVYDGTTGQVIVNTDYLSLQDIIKIEIYTGAEYTVDGDVLTIKDTVSITDGDTLYVTWFNEYPTFDLVSDIYSGGKVNYQLKRQPVNSSYVWVYLNGERLINSKEYRVEVPRNVVYLNVETNTDDIVEIIEFGNQIYKEPRAFEIYKDMLNITHYYRYSIGDVVLTKDLYYYDQTIEVNDASGLDEPNVLRNIPGMIQIAGEKIQYMSKVGNVLGQLRRGVQGTAIKEVYALGTSLSNSGPSDLIPYVDNQERSDFVSDGSSLLIGPLEFTPDIRRDSNGDAVGFTYSDTIPEDYYPCDLVEVFVAGQRLRKDPLTVFDESIASNSPDADKIIEAEFSVDGLTPYIRLTSAVPAGTRILIIRKVGRLWYERAETTASRGITLLNNDTPIATFIDKKTTNLP